MDKILNPLLAPFSAERASKTSISATAVTYAALGLVIGALVLK